AGVYDFQFNDVALQPGTNFLTVKVASPVASDEVTVAVAYQDTAGGGEPVPPLLDILSPRQNAVVQDAVVNVAGTVSAPAGVASVTLAGQPVTLVGPVNALRSFDYPVDLTAYPEGRLEL